MIDEFTLKRIGPPRLTYEEKKQLSATRPSLMSAVQLENAIWLASWRIFSHSNPSGFLRDKISESTRERVIANNRLWLQYLEYEQNVRLVRGYEDEPKKFKPLGPNDKITITGDPVPFYEHWRKP